MPSCDIIIPTFNNAQVIEATIAALYAQEVPVGWQARIIVSDDGSGDSTARLVTKLEVPAGWTVPVILKNDHQGVAFARNCALDIATADIVFFLGADILLAPGALREHLDWHSHNPGMQDAALGMVKWDPKIAPSVLMEWMVHSGPQNDFDSLLGEVWADSAHFFYASHLSLKRSFIHTDRFSEDFKGYGWEDLDFGRRLNDRGMRLRVLHTALGYHHHRYPSAATAARQYASGVGIVTYQKRYPMELIIPAAFSLRQRMGRRLATISWVRGVVWYLVRWAVKRHFSVPQLFQGATTLEFWWGVYNAKKVLHD